MKNVLSIAIVGLCVFAFGTVALGDLNTAGFGNGFIQNPLYEIADGSSGKSVQFNVTQGVDQSSLGTCTMNPMSSNAVESILDEMPVKEPETHIAVENYGYDMVTPPPTTPGTPPYRRPDYPGGDNPNDPDDPNNPGDPGTPPPATNVPEPATILILGLGMAGAVPFARRFRTKRSV